MVTILPCVPSQAPHTSWLWWCNARGSSSSLAKDSQSQGSREYLTRPQLLLQLEGSLTVTRGPCVNLGCFTQPTSTLTPKRQQQHTQRTENSTISGERLQPEENTDSFLCHISPGLGTRVLCFCFAPSPSKKTVSHTCWPLHETLKSLPFKVLDLQGSPFPRRHLPFLSASLTGIVLAVCQALENSTSTLSGESILPGCGWGVHPASHLESTFPGALACP